MADFDLIIIGTGVAGRTALEGAVRAGLRTAIVDRREFGGTCALRGCEPKKVLFAAAEVVHRARGQQDHGPAGDIALDWLGLVRFKRTFTDPAPERFVEVVRSMGATPIHGAARFTSGSTLMTGEDEHSFDTALVATGAVPAPLDLPGAENVVDHERFMDAEVMPQRVVFIGGGFISFEFAAMAAATGSKVVILHRSAHPLKQFDADLVRMLVEQYATMGIEVRVDSPVAAITSRDTGLVVETAGGPGVECDFVVHGAGRVPDLRELDLDVASVAYGPRGIEVDKGMRSVSNPSVYAAGDAAAPGPPLTPVGISQARVAIRNIIEAGSASYEPLVTPSVVFSYPPLAAVGLSEHAARSSGADVAVTLTDTSEWMSTQRVGLRRSGVKTIVERGTGRLLGAHALGHHADELINVLSLAIAKRATADELESLLWAYPTAGSEIVYLL